MIVLSALSGWGLGWVRACCAAVAGLALVLVLVAVPLTWVGHLGLLVLLALAASLVRPDLGALVLLFLLFTRLPDLTTIGGTPPAVAQAVVALPVLCVSSYWLVRRGVWPTVDSTLSWMLAFAAAMLLSDLVAGTPTQGLALLGAYVREIVLVAALATMVTGIRGLRLATWTIVIAGTFAATTALIGEAIGQPLGGLAVVEQSQIVGELAGPRLGGLMGESNWFALMLIPVVPLALYRAFDEARGALRAAALVGAGLVSLAIVMTFSRGGFVGLAAALGLLAWKQRGNPARLLVIVLVPTVLLIATPRVYWDRVLTLDEFLNKNPPTDESLRDRLSLAEIGLLMFVEHPLTGIGTGNYPALYPSYLDRVAPSLPEREQKPLLTPHSGPLQIAFETGFVGLVTFGGVLVAAYLGVREARRRFRQRRLADGSSLLDAIEVALGGYLVGTVFMDASYDRYFWSLVGLIIVSRRAAAAAVLDPAQDSPPRGTLARLVAPVSSSSLWRRWRGATSKSYQRLAQ